MECRLRFPLCCFAFSTIISWGLYGVRCLEFIVGSKFNTVFMVLYSLVAIPGAIVDLGLLWGIADIIAMITIVCSRAIIVYST